MINLYLERRTIQLSPLEQSLAKAAASRHAMRLQLQGQLAHQLSSPYSPLPLLLIQPNTLQPMIFQFSEQLVFHALEEMHQFFNYTSGLYLEPGHPPLFYSRTQSQSASPNKSAIAAIGECIAGLVTQRLYHCCKLSRPIGDFPDLVMRGNGTIYLVEAKATTSSLKEMQRVLDEECLRLAAYVAACVELDTQPLVGLLVGTVLVGETHYHTYLTEVRV
ncbi:hypothetical protein IFO70_33600 [Phormidium tenue FACHB-886]|nr:hypothetical protein [Phormidium tenue FACHB-886]